MGGCIHMCMQMPPSVILVPTNSLFNGCVRGNRVMFPRSSVGDLLFHNISFAICLKGDDIVIVSQLACGGGHAYVRVSQPTIGQSEIV